METSTYLLRFILFVLVPVFWVIYRGVYLGAFNKSYHLLKNAIVEYRNNNGLYSNEIFKKEFKRKYGHNRYFWSIEKFRYAKGRELVWDFLDSYFPLIEEFSQNEKFRYTKEYREILSRRLSYDIPEISALDVDTSIFTIDGEKLTRLKKAINSLHHPELKKGATAAGVIVALKNAGLVKDVPEKYLFAELSAKFPKVVCGNESGANNYRRKYEDKINSKEKENVIAIVKKIEKLLISYNVIGKVE